MINKTKIICTIGPASSGVKILSSLIKKGMDVVRLNFSHGDRETHLEYINNVRTASKRTNVFIPIMQDLQGPKIRVGKLENKAIRLFPGKRIIITDKNIIGNENRISTTYRHFVKDVKKGDFILMDDGLIRLRVISKSVNEIECVVLKGGILVEHKGINLPDTRLSLPSLTAKDKEDLLFGLKNNVDAVALSFVRKADDIIQLRKLITKFGKSVPIVAKIERPEAIENIDEIIGAADVIMVARGDMGVEISPEDVPVLQKIIIKKCNALMRPVITATQMLESMTNSRIPTRAEATDVANSILDGTDCVMLSGETSVGVDPENVVKIMEKIIKRIEIYRKPVLNVSMDSENELQAICKSAIILANDIIAKAIVTYSKTGNSPKYLSSYRLNTEIICITENKLIDVLNHFRWGVFSIKIKKAMSDIDVTNLLQHTLSKSRILKSKDKIVILMSSSKNMYKSADTIKISRR
ncbi:MAG: pyruvate kinase [Candidatus Kapaibacterium sp.]